ncbi:DUF6281 family protein [Nocardioides sp. 503]|uniref:DUF6281 family protein n=1 Tax=Nocardioides sp. 503 TaxID=2508326 RepID=UPI0010701132|nr:DUF6281 family protein [Nocardioides sp. 503]
MSRRSCVAMGLVLVGVIAGLQGCSDGDDGGDCHVRLAFEGERYAVNTDLVAPVPVGVSVGTADEVSCDGTDDVLGHVDVHGIEGVATSTALAVVEAGETQEVTVYLRVGLPRDATPPGWPSTTPSG